MMRIFTRHPDDTTGPSNVKIRASSGYLVTEGSPRLALYCASPQNVTLTATTIDAVDTGMTLEEAHAALTEGLTKTQLVDLGSDFGLSLSETSTREELLESIKTYLQTLANE